TRLTSWSKRSAACGAKGASRLASPLAGEEIGERRLPLDLDAHSVGIGALHRLGLADLPREWPEQDLRARVFGQLFARHAPGQNRAIHDRQRHQILELLVADYRLGVAAFLDGFQILEKAAADLRDALVAGGKMFVLAVGDHALAHPGDEILIHDVAGDPAPGRLVADRAVPGRDRVLDVRLAVLRHAREEPRHRQRVVIVDRHAPFEMIAGEEGVGPQTDAADAPQFVVLVGVLAHPAIDETVIELVEIDLGVARAIGPGLAFEPHAPIRVHPLEMHRVDRVLLALHPVARDFRNHDLGKAVLPGERLPVRHQRRGKRAEIGPDQPGMLAHRIRFDPDARFHVGVGMGHVLVRLGDARAFLVIKPAVIVAAQAALLDEAIGHVGAAMAAMPVDEAPGAGKIAIQRKVFAHEPHRLDPCGLVELAGAGDGLPIAPHQLAHRRIGAGLAQQLVLVGSQHEILSASRAHRYRWRAQQSVHIRIARRPAPLQDRRAHVPARELCPCDGQTTGPGDATRGPRPSAGWRRRAQISKHQSTPPGAARPGCLTVFIYSVYVLSLARQREATMTARTGAEYLKDMRDARDVWLGDRRVDITTEPMFDGSLKGMAGYFDWQHRYAEDCLIEDTVS